MFTVDVNGFWRYSVDEEFMVPRGNLIRAPGGSRERFVSLSLSNALEWTLSRYFDATIIHTHIFPGPFIRETGDHPDTSFFEGTVRFRF
ncbi:MAG: hypothetical protein HC923_10865 [Myxococcales bacterium]|nr:hypothetical protein [Myxococcales bacterium]